LTRACIEGLVRASYSRILSISEIRSGEVRCY
jgi:hypothetical protein